MFQNPLKVAQFNWLIFANESIDHAFYIPYNFNFLRVELSKENKYLVKEIYYVKNIGPFVVDLGIWSTSSGLILNEKFNADKRDMKGARIIRGDHSGIVSS